MTYRELLASLLTLGEYELDQPVQVSINKRTATSTIEFLMTDRGSDELFMSDSPLGFGWDTIKQDF